MDVEKQSKKRGDFLRVSPSLLGVLTAGRLPQEYEVDMLDGISY